MRCRLAAWAVVVAMSAVVEAQSHPAAYRAPYDHRVGCGSRCQQVSCAPPCPPPCAPPQAPPPAAPAAPGAYVAPPQTGTFVGETNGFGVQGPSIQFPAWNLPLPTIQLPSLFQTHTNPFLKMDSATAPFMPGQPALYAPVAPGGALVPAAPTVPTQPPAPPSAQPPQKPTPPSPPPRCPNGRCTPDRCTESEWQRRLFENQRATAELNDRMETAALKKCFGPRAHRIPMSATKSLIGHPQGACGAAGLAATILCMRRGMIHPTINLDQPDPQCDLDYVANEARKAKVNVALCNCIAFGSKNSALVVVDERMSR